MKIFTRFVLAAALLVGLLLPVSSEAANLNVSMVRFDRHIQNTIVTWSVCFKPGSTAQISKVKVSFPDTFTVSITPGDYTPTSSANMVSGITSTALASIAVSGTPSNTNGSKNVTYSFTAIASPSTSTYYCFQADGATAAGLTTPSSAANNVTGSLQTQDAGAVDSGSWGTSIVNGSSNYDQWTVNATVPQLFTYTGPASNTDNFTANLDPASNIDTTGKTVNIKTNAPSGYLVWAKDLNVGLTSSSRSKTIAATTPGSNVATCAAGTESYTSIVTAAQGTSGGTATPTANTIYSTNCGSGLNTSYAMIASSTGTSNGDNITIKERANINNGTPAASDYTDTITVVAAGLF